MERVDTDKESKVTLEDRKNIVVTGVKKIDSFTTKEFIMNTTLGEMYVKGNGLEIVKLDTYQGNLSIKGVIDSITYKDIKEHEESILSKLFK